MPVITDIDADSGISCLKNGKSQVAGRKIKFFPETRPGVGDMNFPEFAEVFAVGIDHGGRVVIEAFNIHFINRNNHDHLIFFGVFGKSFDGWPGYSLGGLVPFDILFGAKIGAAEYFLEAEYLNPFVTSLLYQRYVLLDHGLFYFDGRAVKFGIGGLYMGTFYNSGHRFLL
jgi:hypothetical protein